VFLTILTTNTYLLTPWCTVLLENLIGLQLVKKFPAFHGTRRFITAVTSVHHLSLSWASPIQSIYPHPTSWRSILILSTHLCLGLPSGLLPSGFPSKNLYKHLLLVNVKWSCYRPGMAQRVGRGIALLFHDRGTRRGWVVSSTPRSHITPGKEPVPILQEAGWAPGPVSTGGKSRPQRDSVPDRQTRSQSLYRLSYPAHLITYIDSNKQLVFTMKTYFVLCELGIQMFYGHQNAEYLNR